MLLVIVVLLATRVSLKPQTQTPNHQTLNQESRTPSALSKVGEWIGELPPSASARGCTIKRAHCCVGILKCMINAEPKLYILPNPKLIGRMSLLEMTFVGMYGWLLSPVSIYGRYAALPNRNHLDRVPVK